jgi:hypothetical protein
VREISFMARPGRGLATIATLGVLTTGAVARADIVNFDMSGKIYMKYMYQNDNTQGVCRSPTPSGATTSAATTACAASSSSTSRPTWARR